MGWDNANAFEISDEIYKAWNACDKGECLENDWNAQFADYETKYPNEADELKRRLSGQLPQDFSAKADDFIKACQTKAESIATRKASQNTIAAFAPLLPEIWQVQT